MMASDVSLEIEVKDNYSVVMDKISKVTRSAGNDILGLQSKLDTLNKTKTTLQIDVQSAKQRLSEAKKGFTETSKAINETKANLEAAEQRLSEFGTDEAQREVEELREKLLELNNSTESVELRAAQNNYNNLSSSLSAVTTQAKDTERAMRSLNGTGFDDIMNREAAFNIIRTGVSFASDIITTDLNSSGKTEAATITGDIVSGVLSGAAMGSMGGVGIGTVIGGVAGGITGIIKGITDVNASQTDYFAGVIENQFKSTTEAVDQWLATGSILNAQRTTDNLAFAKILGGKDIADDYLEKIVKKANYTPFVYSDLTALSKSLAVYGYNPDEMLDMIDKIGDTGAALGLDASGMSDIAAYLGRMKISGAASTRYLQPLIGKGIKVYDYLGESLGVAADKAKEMVSKGLIPGEEAAQVIADYMGHDYSGSMEEISKTYNGLTSTVEGWEQEMQNAMGKGYNDAKIPMLEKQISWFEQNGDQLKKVYYKIGQTNAEAENEGTEAKLKAWDDIIANVDKYNGGELRAKMAEAENAEYVAYLESEGYRQIYDAEKSLISRLGTDLALDWAKTGYDQGKLISSSAAAAINDDNSEITINGVTVGFENGHVYTGSRRKKAAFGFSYVPYDDYPVMLHQGERVLTASQNREYSHSSSGVTVIMNGVSVREDADIDRIADELYFRLRAASASYSSVV